MPGGRVLWHNTGHGGAGVTLSGAATRELTAAVLASPRWTEAPGNSGDRGCRDAAATEAAATPAGRSGRRVCCYPPWDGRLGGKPG